MEKTFAKVMGNYEVLNGGSAGEAWDFTSGIPYTYYYVSDATTVNSTGYKAWNIISAALNSEYIVTGGIGS
jgi:Calpain family cysteine protease